MQKKDKKSNELILRKKDFTDGQTAGQMNGAQFLKPSSRAGIILPTSRPKICLWIFHSKICNFEMRLS